MKQLRVALVMPVLDEAAALPSVLAELPRELIDDLVVVDNGSLDQSAEVARALGARVVSEPRRGYGAACLAGIAETADSDVVVFMDGDHSDYPEDLRSLLQPVVDGEADLVIGSRTRDPAARANLWPQARFGNWLATVLMRLLFGITCTDLGPFRVIRRSALLQLGMRDRNYGWTVEMQVRAHRCGLRVLEVPVRYRQRIGKSKISGTLKGTVLAGCKILRTILWLRLAKHREHASGIPPVGATASSPLADMGQPSPLAGCRR